MSRGSGGTRPRARAAPTTVRASGCPEPCSTPAARRSSSSALNSARGNDLRDLGVADRQGPCLVEDRDVDLAELLQGAAVAEDDAVPGGPIDSSDDRDRGGQDQRAWSRHHEHGERADGVARERPGGATDDAG